MSDCRADYNPDGGRHRAKQSGETKSDPMSEYTATSLGGAKCLYGHSEQVDSDAWGAMGYEKNFYPEERRGGEG